MTRKYTKTSKRIISYILILAMLLTSIIFVIPVNVTAASQVIEPTPEYLAVKDGGTYIYDVEDLVALYELDHANVNRIVNESGEGKTYADDQATYTPENYKTYTIQNDLVLTTNHSKAWALYCHINGMNTEGRVCTITLNGAYHVFSWGCDLSIKNLKIDGSVVIDDEDYIDNIGPLVSHGIDGHAVLENITSDVDITIKKWGDNLTSDQRVGGVISKLDLANDTVCNGNEDDILTNVSFTGSITFEATAPLYGYVGGIVGSGTVYSMDKNASTGYKLTMTGCTNEGTITIASDLNGMSVGGLVGCVSSDADITRCVNTGEINISGDYSYSYIGGIVGKFQVVSNTYWKFNINMSDCDNVGNIICTAPYQTDVTYSEIKTLSNGTTTYKNHISTTAKTDDNKWVVLARVGGIIGSIDGVATFENDYAHNVEILRCRNMRSLEGGNTDKKIALGDVRATSVGGIIGYAAKVYITLNLCLNDATIDSSNVIPSSDSQSHAGVAGMIGQLTQPGSYKLDADYQLVDGECKNANRTAVIKNCINEGDINIKPGSKNYNMGGMVGRCYAVPDLTVTKCINDGNITAENLNAGSWSGMGGMVGNYMTVAPVRYNTSNGEHTFSWSALNSGRLNVSYCYNNGTLIGHQAGGMLGRGDQLCADDITLSFKNCYNNGPITADYIAAGIVATVGANADGRFECFGNLQIEYCVNSQNATITAGTDYTNNTGNVAAAGILGISWGDSYAGNYTANNKDYSNKDNEKTRVYLCGNEAKIVLAYKYASTTVTEDDPATEGNEYTYKYEYGEIDNKLYIGEIWGRVNNHAELISTDAFGSGWVKNLSESGNPETQYFGSGASGFTNNNRWTGYHLTGGAADGYLEQSDNDSGTGTSTRLTKLTKIITDSSGIITDEATFRTALEISVEKIVSYVAGSGFTITEGNDTGEDGILYLKNNITLTQNVAAHQSLDNGIFYGNGHTVTLNGANAMFYGINGDACGIYDLNVAGSITENSTLRHISPLTEHGSANGNNITIKNVHSTVNITVGANAGGAKSVGGVFSKMEGGNQTVYFEDVTYSGTIDINQNATDTGDALAYQAVGGIVGQVRATQEAVFINCSTSGTITVGGTNAGVSQGIGGIVGELQCNNLTMRYCTNNATITDENSTKLYSIGGMIGGMGVATMSESTEHGKIRGGKIIECTNTGNLTGKTAGGIIGGVSTLISGDGTFEVFGANNKGTINGTSAAGGLIGDVSLDTYRTYSIKSRGANMGNVTSSGVAGGIVGSAANLIFDNAVNRGAVSGGTGVGGVIGSVSGTVRAEGVVNHGDVSGTDKVGGVAGNVSGTSMYFHIAENGGDVTATGATAAGIVANAAAAGEINTSANAGAISATTNIAGVVGTASAAVTVDDCYNTGVLDSSAVTPYPVSKPGLSVTTTDRDTNLYKEGTVPADKASKYTLSKACGGAAIETVVEEAYFWAYDMNGLNERIAQADAAIAQGLYSSAQESAINTAKAQAQSLLDADWTIEDNWAYQSYYNDVDERLRAALNADGADLNSRADYIISIPAEIPAATTLNAAAEYDLSAELLNYSVFTKLEVSIESENNFKLVNTETSQDIINYDLYADGKKVANNDVLINLEGDGSATPQEKTQTVKIQAVTTSTNIVAGDYSDPISFRINCYAEVGDTYPAEPAA